MKGQRCEEGRVETKVIRKQVVRRHNWWRFSIVKWMRTFKKVNVKYYLWNCCHVYVSAHSNQILFCLQCIMGMCLHHLFFFYSRKSLWISTGLVYRTQEIHGNMSLKWNIIRRMKTTVVGKSLGKALHLKSGLKIWTNHLVSNSFKPSADFWFIASLEIKIFALSLVEMMTKYRDSGGGKKMSVL